MKPITNPKVLRLVSELHDIIENFPIIEGEYGLTARKINGYHVINIQLYIEDKPT